VLESFGQCPEAFLLHQFKLKQLDFESVSFTLRKIEISINSFDLKSNFDTTTKIENYICIRNSSGYKLFKNSKLGNGNFFKTFNIYDSISICYNDTFATKLDPKTSKYRDFEDAFIFLSNYDSAEFFKNDSFVKLSKYKLKQISFYQDDLGITDIVVLYNFSKNGLLRSREVSFNQKNVIPKYITKTIYSNVIYSKKEKDFIKTKFEREYLLSLQIYNQTHLKNSVKIYYEKGIKSIDFEKLNLIQKDGVFYKVDSIVHSNKITLLYYWFYGCKPCNKIKPILYDVVQKYKTSGLEIIGLNNIDYTNQINQADSFFINYKDPIGNMKNFGSGYPLVIIVNKNGQIIGTLKGAMDDDIKRFESHLIEVFGF
jgi:thiol-disulfide isomerase/thioredoxin